MIYSNKLNGYGLLYGQGQNDCDAQYVPWFDDRTDYVSALEETGLLLSGEPGAGKSHIAEDVLQDSLRFGKDCLQIICHINGSSEKGRSETQKLVTQLAQAKENGALVLDNADYVVYTGGRRKKISNAKSARYRSFLRNVIETSYDAGTHIFATSHTAMWRQNHSSIPETEDAFYGIFPRGAVVEKEFTGSMTASNVYRILCLRGVESTKAQQITNVLQSLGSLSFRNAYHIETQETTPEAVAEAVHKVDDIKNQKIIGGR